MHQMFTSATRSATEPCALTATHCDAQPIYTYHEPKHAYIHISSIYIRNRALRTDSNTLRRATNIYISRTQTCTNPNMHIYTYRLYISAKEPCALTATHCDAQPIYPYHEPKHAHIHISFIYIRNRALRTDCNTLQRAIHIFMSCSAYVFVDVVCVFVDVVYVFVDVLSLHVM